MGCARGCIRAMSSSHVHVASKPDSVRWGRLPGSGATPVAEIDDGGVVVFETVSHEGLLPDQGSDPIAFFGSHGIPRRDVLDDVIELAGANLAYDPAVDGPHIVTGPVAIRGARAGDVLRVEFIALEPRTRYGIISNRHGRGVLPDQFPATDAEGDQPLVVSHLATVDDDGRTGRLRSANGRTLHFPLAPFLGLVGVAPAGDDEVNSRPPGRHGGNLDIRHLGLGSSLLLPLQADGALLYVGDPHFAQGNGEVALTAFEAPLRAGLRVSIERSRAARVFVERSTNPWGETPTSLIAIGLGASLDEAMHQAVRHAVTMVSTWSGVDEQSALAYLSAAADFEVSQAVNGIRGIHCVIRKSDLREAEATAQ
jgi:acetamidase/formamidase